MNFFSRCERQFNSRGRAEVAKICGIAATEQVGANKNTLVLAKASRGIPDLQNIGVRPADTAVDLLFFLPESWRLEGNLGGIRVLGLRNC